MNDQHQNSDFCYYHPEQALVGICPFCLNEKLLLLEANQARRNCRRSRHEDGCGKKAVGYIPALPKMFALGSLLNRLELRRHRRSRRRSYGCDDSGSNHSQSTSTSLEDSFISITIEENGVALWDHSKVTKAAQHHLGLTKEASWPSGSSKTVVEHPKGTRPSLRWRKRIGRLLHLFSKGSGRASHVDGVGGAKATTKAWIKALTKRKTNLE